MNLDAVCLVVFAIPALILWWTVLSGNAAAASKISLPKGSQEFPELKQSFGEDWEHFSRREEKYIKEQLKLRKGLPKRKIDLRDPDEIKETRLFLLRMEESKWLPTGEDVRRVYVLPTLVLSVVMPFVVSYVLTGQSIGAVYGFSGLSIGIGLVIAALLGNKIAEAIARGKIRRKARSTDSSK